MQILRVEVTAAILSHVFMDKVMIYMLCSYIMFIYMYIYFSNQKYNHSFTSLEK